MTEPLARLRIFFQSTTVRSVLLAICAITFACSTSKSGGGALPLGDFCGAADDCKSGHCVDGVCCNTTCTDLCQSCAQTLEPGQCLPAKAGTDPRQVCRDEGARSCGQDGTCDGGGSCRLYLQGTLCELSACAEPTFSAKSCDGLGSCGQELATSCGNYHCGVSEACLSSCSSDADCIEPSVCSRGVCGGLMAEYFYATDLTDPKVSRVDPSIDFSWTDATPDASIGLSFSVEWTGSITPRFDETYTFYLLSDDGARLFVNGFKLIDDWMPAHLARESTGTVSFHAGQKYPIKVQYWQKVGLSVVGLSWSSASEPRASIPTSALFPSAGPMAQ